MTAQTAAFEIITPHFAHTQPAADFINPCSFGADFCRWIIALLAPLPDFRFSAPVMEDFGHSLFASHPAGNLSITLSYAEDGPTPGPARWVGTLRWTSRGLLRSWISAPDPAPFTRLRQALGDGLRTLPQTTIVQLP